MPFIDITYSASQHQQADILQASELVHSALIEHFKIPPDDFFQLLHPLSPEQMLKDPNYLITGTRSDKWTIIKITCAKGRTNQQKQALYHAIATQISNTCHIPKADIFIILYETDRSSWSFGNGIGQLIEA